MYVLWFLSCALLAPLLLDAADMDADDEMAGVHTRDGGELLASVGEVVCGGDLVAGNIREFGTGVLSSVYRPLSFTYLVLR